jgi:hypothetical protein
MTIPREPTSYPSFLHWDLAYVEALRQPRTADLPVPWRARVDAWRTLVRLWLLGELDEQTVSVPEPLRQYLPRTVDGVPRWLESVTWLSFGGRTVGVTSPAVLVRPLPDVDLNAPMWSARADEPSEDRLAGLIDHLLAAIDGVRGERHPALHTLRSVITTQFPGSGRAGAVDSPACAHTLCNPRSLESVELRFKRGKARDRVFVPRCAQCRKPLLPAEAEVPASEEQFSLTCSCGQANRFELQSLFCAWYGRPKGAGTVADRDRLLAWSNGGHQLDKALVQGFPPRVQAAGDGQALEFLYEPSSDEALLGQPPERRTLRLRVGRGCTVETIRTESTLFDHLLIPPVAPGDPRTEVLPVKPEYADLCGSAEITRNGTAVLRLRGLPSAVSLPIRPATASEAAAAVLLPDPDICPPRWQKFWAAASAGYRVQVGCGEPGRRVDLELPVAPVLLALTREGDASVGCSLRLKGPDRPGEAVSVAAALDFGTTSSVLHLQTKGAMGAPLRIPFKPADLRQSRALRRLFGNPDGQQSASDVLLPSLDSADDPALIPSEICRVNPAARRARSRPTSRPTGPRGPCARSTSARS